MSTNLELCQFDFPNIRVPCIKTRKPLQSCGATVTSCGSNNVILQEIKTSDVGDDCRTPTSEKHKIPAILTCPPAPRKPKRVASCKRKLSEFEFFEMVNREEVDSFVQSSLESVVKRRCPACK